MIYRTKWSVRFLLASALIFSCQAVIAGLSLNDSPSSNSIRSILNGPGLQVENLQFVKGVKGQYGTFVDGTEGTGDGETLGITDGIFLTTGSLNSVLGPNDSDKYTYNTRIQYADPDLTAIAESAIFDPVIIEFDITPEGDQVNFLLVFGSEEYPEYVCSKFNDVFGLFVSGPGISGVQNAAHIPGSDYPIAVNNLNNGAAGTVADGTDCNLSNSVYFVDNGNGTGATGTQLDGFSRPLTASLSGLQAGERYRVKLALADTGDQAYDSAAFFKWLTSTSSEAVDLELSAVPSTTKPAKEGFVDIRYTLSNTSERDTRLVEVGIELPAGVVVVGDDSSGSFNSLDGVWDVGDVSAGSRHDLNIRVRVGDAYSYQVASEILFAFNEDSDSTPYNRLSISTEDDTALFTLYPTSNHAPLITYASSAETATVSFPENETGAVVDLDVSDLDGETEGAGLSWMIAGGDDAQRFTLGSQGQLYFIEIPNFENPVDENQDNSYEVSVKVCDSHVACDVQVLTIIVTDVVEDRDGDGVPADVEEAIGSNPNEADTDGDGVDDKVEIGSDFNNPKDTDNDGIPDVLDTDDDGDGILTAAENYNAGSPADDDSDGDGIPDYLDSDDDNDGLLTSSENYNGGSAVNDDTDGDGTPDYLDNDDDGDGQLTKDEQADPNGDGTPADAVDSEGDGTPDYLDDDNANAPNDDNDGDGLTNAEEKELGTNLNSADSDGDGMTDKEELGDKDNPTDTDHDGIIDSLDPDDDNDGILSVDENYNGGTPADDDSDLDGTPDYLDDDDDADSIPTRYEDYNGNGAADEDTDGDGVPDYLDVDDDDDGLHTQHENYNAGLPLDDDTDGDGVPDYLDDDDDGDGLLTCHESADLNENGRPDDALDSDSDSVSNYLDNDDDGDGVLTLAEDADPNGDGNPDDAVDVDHDKIVKYLDPDMAPFVQVRLRTILQGPYDAATGLMHDKLRVNQMLPMQQPYSLPFGYEGSEVLTESVLNVEGDDAVVDWLLIEVRDQQNPADVLAATVAVVQRDGDLVMSDTGSRDLIITGVESGEHYIAIRHRNHLGVMTAQAVSLDDQIINEYDFTSDELETYGEEARLSISSHEVMWVGDLNNSTSIIIEGPGSDMSIMLGAVLVAEGNLSVNANYPLMGYYPSDVNMDGKTIYSGPNNDANLLIGNMLLHPKNSAYYTNFVIQGSLP